ncbi:MAG: hypothetical protein HY313_11505 [Acidobacteria bacterium]|nr:hypothetical protein [Acidobacteriota bacterium]
MNKRLCISCENPIQKRAKEHVIADWLLKELGIGEEQLWQFIADSTTGQAKEARTLHALNSFKEGRVCSNCNNGWMSQLENEVKPILLALLSGAQNPTSIPEFECSVLARWTLKTAIVLSCATPLGHPLPREHLKFLRDKPAMPSQVGIFAAINIPTREFGYYQRNDWPNWSTEGVPDLSESMTSQGFKLAFHLKHLLLMVAHIPRPTSRFVLAAGLHIPLWPPEPFFASYRVDLRTTEPHDIREVMEIFNNRLGALHLKNPAG